LNLETPSHIKALFGALRFLTRGAPLQPGSEGRHHARVSGLPRVSHPDVEGTTGNMAAVEADVDGVHAVLPRDEPDGELV